MPSTNLRPTSTSAPLPDGLRPAGSARVDDSASIVRSWREQGYVIHRGLFSPERCRALRPVCERIWARAMARDARTGEPSPPERTNLHFCHHPDYLADPADRRLLLEAGSDLAVRALAQAIHGEEPLFRTLSLWFNPAVGSDGHWHRDTQFMHPDEAEELARFPSYREDFGNGMQLQIALVRSADSEYVPGSHLRWDTPAENRIRRASGPMQTSNDMPGAVRIALEPGDAVAFNPLGLHRGRYHTDRLRRTFMVTYTRSSRPQADQFSQQPWFLDPAYTADLDADAQRFYQRFIDAYAPLWRQPVAPAP